MANKHLNKLNNNIHAKKHLASYQAKGIRARCPRGIEGRRVVLWETIGAIKERIETEQRFVIKPISRCKEWSADKSNIQHLKRKRIPQSNTPLPKGV